MDRSTLRVHEDERLDGRSERGTALVLVLIVIVGIMGMLAFLVPQSQTNIKSQGQTQELVDMQLLLRSGIAAAIDEITEKVDPDDEGTAAVGAGIGNFWSGSMSGETAYTGFASSFDRTNKAHLAKLGTQLKAGTRNMGYYATWVSDPGSGEYELNVVVAYPSFADPRLTAGAVIRIAEFNGGRNAVSLSGPFSSGGGNFGIGDETTVTIDIDGGTYAGFNVSDPDMLDGSDMPGGFERFVSDIMNLGSISGKSTGNPAGKPIGVATTDGQWSGNSGEDWDTVENISAQDLQLSNDVIDTVADDFLNIINGALANDEYRLWADDGGSTNQWASDNLTNGVDTGHPPVVNLNNLVGTHSAPPDPATEKVWRIGALTGKTYEFIGRDIQGSGSLVLNGGNGVKFKGGTTMDWDGDVFWLASGNSKEIDIEDADLTINGNFYVIMNPLGSNDKAKIHIKNDASKLTVNGSIVLVAAGSTNAIDFHVDKAGAEVYVNGLFLALGSNVSFQVEGKDSSNHAKFEVNGSLIAGVQEGGSITEFEFTKYVDAKLNYQEANYENATSEFGEATDALKKFTNMGVVEVSGATKLDEFHRAVANSDGSSTNYNPDWTVDAGNTTVDARMGM